MNPFKENQMGNNASHTVKQEPQEARIAPAVLNRSSTVNVKAEVIDIAPKRSSCSRKKPSAPLAGSSGASDQPQDALMEDTPPLTPVPVVATDYTVSHSGANIAYSPEYALEQGLKMVKKISSSIECLQLGSKLRQEVWKRELDSLRSQGSPTTLIAVCGATGAGKSSILNAILDDNIVPTSGMRACTAVPTEIAYHKKKTIEADVSFLSREDWAAELGILLGDLVDEDGNLKRSTDLKSDAGVAWQKVYTFFICACVYPTVSQEKLVTMTVQQIIDLDPKIAKILGATKNIVAKDSKTFAVEIANGAKDGKKKDKGEETLMDKVRDAAGKSKKSDATGPALWPLIRQVNVRCSAPALSTGAMLVDLPGTGDSNAARNSIAKEYMKKCDCIWILAPITRAVDDKIAKDLLGDAFKTQLMILATKCDDISCTEVIRALNIEEDPDLEAIEERIEQLSDETTEWKKKKGAADRLVNSLDAQLKSIRPILKEYQEHLQALKDGEAFTPRLTAKKPDKPKVTKGKKRKNARGGKKGSPKRRRSGSFDSAVDDDDDEKISSSDDEDSDASHSSGSDSASESGNEDSDAEKDSDEEKDSDDEKDSDNEKEADSDVETIHDAEDEVTEESIELKITETKVLITNARERHSEARKQKKEAIDHLATLKKKAIDAQKAKNAFCSLKRSEYSRDALKEDFRSGLKDLDDAAAEKRDPDNFDPGVDLRDYNAIDLPVFTCSSRDYVRLKKQVKGDGEPSCFSNVKDTGIPALRAWCHSLTISSRERAARNFIAHTFTFATGVKQYVAGIGDVTAADREALRERWESGEQEVDPAEQLDDEDPFAAILGGGASLYTMTGSVPKVDRYGEPIGITPRLTAELQTVVESSISQLKEHLRDGLEERCRIGAANAAGAAVTTSDDFAGSMHWASYRATLRRHGEYRRDLNVELITPFTRHIAQKWQQVFEADIFAPLLSSTIACINKLVADVETSAAPGLRDRAKLQGESCLEEARVALNKTVDTVKDTLTNEQKEVSRCLAPHVREQLVDGYDEAMEERGKGSVARQKAKFRSYITNCKDDIFEDGADVIMERLNNAAEAIGHALDEAMDNLAQKIEVNLAVLWEGARDDPAQVKARSEVVKTVSQVLDQLSFLTEAEKARHRNDTDVAMT
ncbi:hypothetical protein B0H10DRAFT_2045676 [Mycena sp. CBHHK59/15]|nr:hypothetical protein B0H10DRAFT_2045676 [Mycena sp. CBHHK59/15]